MAMLEIVNGIIKGGTIDDLYEYYNAKSWSDVMTFDEFYNEFVDNGKPVRERGAVVWLSDARKQLVAESVCGVTSTSGGAM